MAFLRDFWEPVLTLPGIVPPPPRGLALGDEAHDPLREGDGDPGAVERPLGPTATSLRLLAEAAVSGPGLRLAQDPAALA